MTNLSELTGSQEPNSTTPPNWVERFSNRENYSPYSLAVLEACRVFFEQQLSQEHKDFVEKTGAAILVTGSLLRGNARPGSDIDLMLVIDRSKFPSDISYFGYGQASDLLQTAELKNFVVTQIKEKYPDLYKRLLEVRLDDLKQRIERYQEKNKANPGQYSNDPNHWGNLSEDKQGQYVEEHMMSFYVEEGIFDINGDLEETVIKLDTEDDLIHGLIALLFSSDLQTIAGNRESLRNVLIGKLRELREKNPEKFDELYSRIIKGLQGFLSYNGKNHFYLDEVKQINQEIAMPLADELLQR